MKEFCTRQDSSLQLLFLDSCLAFAVGFGGREEVLCSESCSECVIVNKGESTQVVY